MSRRLKELVVDELLREYQGVESCLVVDVHRADGEEAVALRRYLLERGVRLRAVRNSMAARALAQVGLGEVERYLEGPCALASGGEDLVVLAKALIECRQKHRTLAVRGGVSAGRPVEAREVEQLAELGSVERLRALVAGAFQIPLRQLAWALAAPLSGLASVLQQVAKEEGDKVVVRREAPVTGGEDERDRESRGGVPGDVVAGEGGGEGERSGSGQ